jgi:hypothetical protein
MTAALLRSGCANPLRAQGGIFCGQAYDFAVNNQKAWDAFPGGAVGLLNSRGICYRYLDR